MVIPVLQDLFATSVLLVHCALEHQDKGALQQGSDRHEDTFLQSHSLPSPCSRKSSQFRTTKHLLWCVPCPATHSNTHAHMQAHLCTYGANTTKASFQETDIFKNQKSLNLHSEQILQHHFSLFAGARCLITDCSGLSWCLGHLPAGSMCLWLLRYL